jgi:single-strand DNA-binding protein
MARGINKVTLVGNLGGNPDCRSLPDGRRVANFSLATSYLAKPKEGQTKGDELVEWHRVVFFDRLAEIAEEFLRTGSTIYLEGRLRTRNWTDDKNGGIQRYTTEIIGSELRMLDAKGADTSSPENSTPPAEDAPAYDTPPPEDFHDELPF